MKIIDLKCVIIGDNFVVCIIIDEGIDGYGQVEFVFYLKFYVLFYWDWIFDKDFIDVEWVMFGIRQLGGFKFWGKSVSAIEMVFWDIVGKVVGVLVYKLLGGKICDCVWVYFIGGLFLMWGFNFEDYVDYVVKIQKMEEGFIIIKQGIVFYSLMYYVVFDFFYGELVAGMFYDSCGLMIECGLNYVVVCVVVMKEVLGDGMGFVFDCGLGMMVLDAICFVCVVESYNVMWFEDMFIGDYMLFVLADFYWQVIEFIFIFIYIGEQIYLCQYFKDFFEKQVVNIVGFDLVDVGGIVEFKWIVEYVDLYGILMVFYGVIDGLIGLAVYVQVVAILLWNYIVLEYLQVFDWWYGIVEGLFDFIVVDGYVQVWDVLGFGVWFIEEEVKKYLFEEDVGFFD